MANKEGKGATVRILSEEESANAFTGPFRSVAEGDRPNPSHVIDGSIPTRLYGRQPGRPIIVLPEISIPQGTARNHKPRLH